MHPAYWYYSARGMFPNVLFVDLLIIGFFLLWRAFHSRAIFLFFFSGLCVGTALIVRLSELPWVFSLTLFIWICSIRRFRVWGTVLFLSGVLCMFALLFYYNDQIYGNPLSSGYMQIDTESSGAHIQKAFSTAREGEIMRAYWWRDIASSLKLAMDPFLKYIFPFGFVPDVFKKNFFTYGISLFWWFTVPAVIGMCGLFFQGIRSIRARLYPKEWGYICAVLLAGAWLVPFYGSWVVSDTISGEVTLGNSYVRYWLVLYCLTIPFAAYTLCHLAAVARSRIVKNIALPLFCAVFALYSFQGAFLQETDGLFAVSKHIGEYRSGFSRMAPFLEKDAVIFSSRSDKIFFPQRRAAQSFDRYEEVEIIPTVLKKTQVYYYGLDQAVVTSVTKKYFSPRGLRLEYMPDASGDESLYRVVHQER